MQISQMVEIPDIRRLGDEEKPKSRRRSAKTTNPLNKRRQASGAKDRRGARIIL